MQKHDAIYVAGYNSWSKNFGRHVKKGEKGIKIIAPSPIKKKVETNIVDKDDNEGLTVTGTSGASIIGDLNA